MKKATCKTSHFGKMGHLSHHILGLTTQMVLPVINPTSPPTKRFLENSKLKDPQSTHKGAWDNFLVIQHDFSS
jgi:hypothetical protein